MANYCVKCGIQLEAEWSVCPNCAKPIKITGESQVVKFCPKCGGKVESPDESYCRICGTSLPIKIKKTEAQKRSVGKLFSVMCVASLVFFIAALIAWDVWYRTKTGSLEELIISFIFTIFLYAIFACWFIFGSIIAISLTNKAKLKTPPPELQLINTVYFNAYIAFILVTIGVSFISLVIDNGLILLRVLFTLCALVGLAFIIVNRQQIISWIKERDVIGFTSIILMMIGIWVPEGISYLFQSISIIGLYVWFGWIAFEIIKKKVQRMNLVGFMGIVIEIIAMILSTLYRPTTFSIINIISYLGLFIWIGGFILELLKREIIYSQYEQETQESFQQIPLDQQMEQPFVRREQISPQNWIFQLIGAIIVLIALFTPAAWFETTWLGGVIEYSYIWMFGLNIYYWWEDGRSFYFGFGIPLLTMVSILCTVLIIIFTITIIINANNIRLGNIKIEKRWLGVRLFLLFIIPIIWIIMMEMHSYYLVAEHIHSFWSLYNLGFGIIGIFIGVGLMIIGILVSD